MGNMLEKEQLSNLPIPYEDLYQNYSNNYGIRVCNIVEHLFGV